MSQLHETLNPSVTLAAALLRTSGVMRFSVPSSSSGPHRPQLERLSNQEMTSSSEGSVGMVGSLLGAPDQLSNRIESGSQKPRMAASLPSASSRYVKTPSMTARVPPPSSVVIVYTLAHSLPTA